MEIVKRSTQDRLYLTYERDHLRERDFFSFALVEGPALATRINGTRPRRSLHANVRYAVIIPPCVADFQWLPVASNSVLLLYLIRNCVYLTG